MSPPTLVAHCRCSAGARVPLQLISPPWYYADQVRHAAGGAREPEHHSRLERWSRVISDTGDQWSPRARSPLRGPPAPA